MKYKASAAWLSKEINCTLDGIVNQCHGNCCTHNFYPCTIPELGIIKHCFWLGDKGCILTNDEKPILCMLYPIIFNDNNTMIIFARCLFQSCKNTYKKGGKSIIENQSENIIHIFGQEFYDTMYKNIITLGRDFYFEMPKYITTCITIENLERVKRIVPTKRNEYPKNYPEYFSENANFNISLVHNPKSL